MRKSLRTKKRMFRDFAVLKDKYVNNNYLKNLHSIRKEFCKSNGVSWSHLEFLIWAYDLEFWTIDYAAEEYGFNRGNLANRTIYNKIKPSRKGSRINCIALLIILIILLYPITTNECIRKGVQSQCVVVLPENWTCRQW